MAYSQEELIAITRGLIIDNTTNQVTPAKVRSVIEAVISSLTVTDAVSLNAIAPLVIDTFTNTFSITESNASQDGYLSKEDWARYNQAVTDLLDKLPKGTYTGTASDLKAEIDLKLNISDYNVYFQGKYTSLANLQSAVPTGKYGDYAIVDPGTGTAAREYIWDNEEEWVPAGPVSPSTTDALPEGSTNLYFTSARVLAVTLSGLSILTGGQIISTDTVLAAFGKIQKQINDLPDSFLTIATNQDVTGIKTYLSGNLGLRNIANTFTSFFTNANTASRTYTLPNKDGTVAMISDLPTNVVNTGTQNKLLKYVNAAGTQAGNSRIKEDGEYIGVDTQWPLSADFMFGFLAASRTLGIEDSISTSIGKDFIIKAGRSINFDPSGGSFNPLGQASRAYGLMCENPVNGDVYCALSTGDIYKQSGGSGNFLALGQTSRSWSGISSDSSGNIYACVQNGDVYKQTGGTGNFMPLGQTVRNYNGITVLPSGDYYASVYGGDIYKSTGGGALVALGQTSRSWLAMTNSVSGDVYCVVSNGDIYKQTGGTGNFVGLGQTNRFWVGICATPSGDIYACVGTRANVVGVTGLIYKQTGGAGSFNSVGAPVRAYTGICSTSAGNLYASVNADDIYFCQLSVLGTANLNGGNLKLKSGTAKGTGSNKIEFYTGQKTVSGTDMQAETLRAYYDESGNYKRIGTPVYADNAAALAGGLTAGMEYRTSTGVKMEVY